MMNSIQKIYRTTAILFLTTCLIFILVNVMLSIFFQINDSLRGGTYFAEWEDVERQKIVQPDLSEQEITSLAEETIYVVNNLAYAPYTQFKEPVFQGIHIQIDENGFRHSKNQGVWPPDPANFNIFMFGGSTTFGVGVSRDHTIASHLQEYLSGQVDDDVYVYNFGRSAYFLTQERILFEQLLLADHQPDLVIFLDGLNDVISKKVRNPGFTAQLTEFQQGERRPLISVLKDLPIMRLARSLKARLQTFQDQQPPAQPEVEDVVTIGERYLANKRLIEAATEAHDIRALFVWQPTFFYNYDQQYHLFYKPLPYTFPLERYEYMAQLHQENQLGPNFLWLADMQVGLQEPLYVDLGHYNGKMSRMIAVEIANWLLEQEMMNKELSKF